MKDGKATYDAPAVHGIIGLEEVEEGDLVFCARPGPLQTLCSRAAEPWRHVGLSFLEDGEMMISEVGGGLFSARSVRVLSEKYEALAVGKPSDDNRQTAIKASEWAREQVGKRQTYAWDDLILSGIIATTRCYLSEANSGRIDKCIQAAVAELSKQRAVPGEARFTCSSFIAYALLEAGFCLDIDLTSSRRGPSQPRLIDLIWRAERPLRHGPETRMTTAQAVWLARSLLIGVAASITPRLSEVTTPPYRWATPGDIWRSEIVADRFYLPTAPKST